MKLYRLEYEHQDMLLNHIMMEDYMLIVLKQWFLLIVEVMLFIYYQAIEEQCLIDKYMKVLIFI